MQVGLIQHTTTDQFEEDAGRGLHVGTGVVGRVEVLAKQQVMELAQTRQLELAALAARELAELGRLLRAGVDDLPTAQGILATAAQELAAQHIEVEVDIVADKYFALAAEIINRSSTSLSGLPYFMACSVEMPCTTLASMGMTKPSG